MSAKHKRNCNMFNSRQITAISVLYFVYDVFNHLSQQTTKYDMDMRKCVFPTRSIPLEIFIYLNQMSTHGKNINKTKQEREEKNPILRTNKTTYRSTG